MLRLDPGVEIDGDVVVSRVAGGRNVVGEAYRLDQEGAERGLGLHHLRREGEPPALLPDGHLRRQDIGPVIREDAIVAVAPADDQHIGLAYCRARRHSDVDRAAGNARSQSLRHIVGHGRTPHHHFRLQQHDRLARLVAAIDVGWRVKAIEIAPRMEDLAGHAVEDSAAPVVVLHRHEVAHEVAFGIVRRVAVLPHLEGIAARAGGKPGELALAVPSGEKRAGSLRSDLAFGGLLVNGVGRPRIDVYDLKALQAVVEP